MKTLVMSLCFLISMVQTTGGEVLTSDQKQIVPLGPNDVVIGPNAVRVPLGRISLVRKNKEYCAVIFTGFWTGKTEEDWYATYESYYQGDKTGDFSNRNVQFRKEKLSSPKPRGIGRFAFSFGNRDVLCGSVTLEWTGKGWLYFYGSNQKEGDYGIELAPTKWTDISQVNILDPRLRWYRYDQERKRVNIPIDQLWEDKGTEK